MKAMLTLTIVLIVLCAPLAARAATSRQGRAVDLAMRRPIAFSSLVRGFAEPDLFYAPFAFWFWDAPLDPAEAAYQAREMCRQRLNPGYAHARYGLPREQWLSPLWFDSLDGAVAETDAAGMYVGYCDEYWWPSGQAGGRVLAAHPELAAVSLRWDVIDVPGGQEAKLPESFFTVAAELADDGKIRSSTLRMIGEGEALSWTAPTGKWRVYSFTKYHHPGLDGSPINYLDDRLPSTFIQMAYEPYARHFGERLGKNPCGIFMDSEGDYGWKLAWSDHLAKTYGERKGRDIRLWMPLMVDQDAEGLWAKARWDWFDVVSDIYSNEYFGALSRWAEKHGMYFTMHIWEESLLLQSQAAGDFFELQRAVTMPGNDSLVLKPLEPHDFKEPQSVAEFEGRQFMSEVMGVIGWEVTPVVMKQCANALINWGVSHVMPHGINLNRDLNTIPYPPDFFTENPYWPYMHIWTDFVRRACYVNSHGHVVPDVLLVYPIDSIWVLSGGRPFDGTSDADFGGLISGTSGDWGEKARRIDEVYSNAINELSAARVEYLIGDRRYLREMSVKDGRLTMGGFRFESVVLPPMVILPLDVAGKVAAFAEAGGSVYLLGELPSASTENGADDPKMLELAAKLRTLPSVVDCSKDGLAAELARKDSGLASQVTFRSGEFPILETHRRVDGRDFYWLVNNTDRRQECKLFVRDAKGGASIWDCETGKSHPVGSEETPSGSEVRLAFKPFEAYWLVFDPGVPARAPSEQAPGTRATIAKLDGSWHIQVPRTGQPSPSPSIAKFLTVPWKASWLRVDDTSRFRYVFDLPAAPTKAEIKITADETFRLCVNGKIVPHEAWDDLWRQVRTVDLTGLLGKGKNVIAVLASKPGGRGGVILQGEAKLPGGRVVELASGRSWRTGGEPAAAEPPFGKWIWLPEAETDQAAFFRTTLDLPEGSKIAAASLTMTADNSFVLYVNGREVGTSDNWTEPATYDLAESLHEGRNVIAVKAWNEGGPAGLLAGMSVRLTDGTTMQMRSDGEWRCSDKAVEGWTEPGFDDSGWPAATVLADYGAAPWGVFSKDLMQIVPEWAGIDFDDSSWSPAEVVGVPPVEPWIDVPKELVAGVDRPLGSWVGLGVDRFSGYLDYTTSFKLDKAGAGPVTLDLGEVKHMAEAFVNGKKVGERLWPPFEFDITRAVRKGENTVRVRVGNLVTNEMLQFGTSTGGWGPAPGDETYDAGLFGPVTVRANR